MFSRIVITLGWIGMAAAIGYFIVFDRLKKDDHERAYIQETQQILLVAGMFVAGGYALKYLGSAVGVDKGRCKKCGKRVAKSEMFCFDHQKEIIWEAREKNRMAGLKSKTKA